MFSKADWADKNCADFWQTKGRLISKDNYLDLDFSKK